MSRSAVVTGIGGLLAALLLVSVATAGEVSYAERSPSFSLADWISELGGIDVEEFEVELPEEQSDPFLIWEVDLPNALAVILELLLAAAVCALVLEGWRRRPRLSWRRGRGSEDFEVVDDLAALVAADVDGQRRALRQGTPRNGIVACWLRLEAAANAAGFERDAAETSDEATARLLTQFAIDHGAVGRLASLYREARFSSHPMGEDQRAAAVESLETIHVGLDSSRSATV